LIALLLLVFVRHFLEHVQQIRVLPVDVSKNFDRCLELEERFFIFENFLSLLNQKLDHFDWQVDEGYRLGIFLSIVHNVVVQVINEDIHDKGDLVIHVLLGDACNGLFELTAPLFLDVKSLGLILLRLQVFIKKSLQLFALVLFSQALFRDGREVLIHILRDGILFFIDLRRSTSSALHIIIINYYSNFNVSA
jgi:hypothetical protein